MSKIQGHKVEAKLDDGVTVTGYLRNINAPKCIEVYIDDQINVFFNVAAFRVIGPPKGQDEDVVAGNPEDGAD